MEIIMKTKTYLPSPFKGAKYVQKFSFFKNPTPGHF